MDKTDAVWGLLVGIIQTGINAYLAEMRAEHVAVPAPLMFQSTLSVASPPLQGFTLQVRLGAHDETKRVHWGRGDGADLSALHATVMDVMSVLCQKHRGWV